MIIDSEDLLDYHRSRWPLRLARNIYAAAALRSEYNRGFDSCSCGWNDGDNEDDVDLDEGCVLGTNCCNPHVYHSSEECYSAEMADDFWGEARRAEQESATTPRPGESG